MIVSVIADFEKRKRINIQHQMLEEKTLYVFLSNDGAFLRKASL